MEWNDVVLNQIINFSVTSLLASLELPTKNTQTEKMFLILILCNFKQLLFFPLFPRFSFEFLLLLIFQIQFLIALYETLQVWREQKINKGKVIIAFWLQYKLYFESRFFSIKSWILCWFLWGRSINKQFTFFYFLKSPSHGSFFFIQFERLLYTF